MRLEWPWATARPGLGRLGPPRSASGRFQPPIGTIAHEALAADGSRFAEAHNPLTGRSVAACKRASRLRSQLGTAWGRASRLGAATRLHTAPTVAAEQPGEVN